MYVLLSGWPFPCKILTRDLIDSIRWNIKGKRGFLSGMEMWVLTGLEMETKGQERGADCSKWQNDLLVCCPKLSSPILLMDTCFHCMIIIKKKNIWTSEIQHVVVPYYHHNNNQLHHRHSARPFALLFANCQAAGDRYSSQITGR